MPKIHTENFLVSVHTMITKKPIKQILNDKNLEEMAMILEEYIQNLNLDLNGIAVEVEAVSNDDSK